MVALLTTHRVLGVDWSGAANAGMKAAVADARFDAASGELHVSCARLARSLPARPRAPAEVAAALRAHVGEQRAGAAGAVLLGVDAALGVSSPEPCRGGESWAEWATAFAARFPSPVSFREAALAADRRAGAGERKRACDAAARTPFAPHNLRMYRQTHAAVALLAAPLLQDGAALAFPMMAEDGSTAVDLDRLEGRAGLLEVCPASLLKRVDLYKPPYKGKARSHRESRRRILDAALDRGFLSADGERRVVLRAEPDVIASCTDDHDGDVLDSVLCCVCVALAVRERTLIPPPGNWHAEHATQGAVYF